MLIRSRREFLKTSLKSVTTLGAVGAMSKFGEMNALAAGSGYQALVCIFLSGGNDGHNTVIPITTAQQNYSLYQTGRQGLALAQNSLLPVAAGSDTYGLHPRLVEIQNLYNAKKRPRTEIHTMPPTAVPRFPRAFSRTPIRPASGRPRSRPASPAPGGAGASPTICNLSIRVRSSRRSHRFPSADSSAQASSRCPPRFRRRVRYS
jgi:hypothetical protein